MAIGFLLVTFPEERAVLADGTRVGFTNHVLMLPEDEYDISLEGDGCSPASQHIVLAGTSIVKPLAITFSAVGVPALADAAEPAFARRQRGASSPPRKPAPRSKPVPKGRTAKAKKHV